MRLGFPIQNMGYMDFLSPVDRSYRHVTLINMEHIFSSAIYSPFIPPIRTSSIICEPWWH